MSYNCVDHWGFEHHVKIAVIYETDEPDDDVTVDELTEQALLVFVAVKPSMTFSTNSKR